MVGSDNRDGGRQVGTHLASLGRKRVAYLGANQPTAPEFRDRYLGLCDALQAAKLSTEAALQIDVIDSTELAGYAAAQAPFARGVAFDALPASPDRLLKSIAERDRARARAAARNAVHEDA